MFYAAYRDHNGEEHGNLYFSHQEYYRDTFNPLTEFLAYIPFKVSGKTYQERQESVRNQAIEFSLAFTYGHLSYEELHIIQSWFHRNGSRYGLIKEFHENAIC